MRIDDLPTPVLVVDLERLDRNLEGMAAAADRLGVALRPHVKTHKSIDIARRQRRAGARGITVSTLEEARFFCDNGFDDITWAFPLIPSRLDDLVDLAQRARLNVVVDSLDAVRKLEARDVRVAVFLKVDCGYHRAGVDPRSDVALDLARRLADSPSLTFAGILTHAGHSYGCRHREEIVAVAREERDVMSRFAGRLRRSGVDVPVVSIGSTPTLSVVDALDGIDEIRPGNYALYDLSQVLYGSCSAADCAATVISSVVSQQPGAQHSVIDAGALALSKDPGPVHLGHRSYGAVFRDYPDGSIDDELRITALSQEHGIVDRPMAIGSRLRILPNHSCLAVAQFDEFAVARGEEVVDRWPIFRGR